MHNHSQSPQGHATSPIAGDNYQKNQGEEHPDSGFTMVEVIVAAILSVIITVAVSIVVATTVGVLADVERNTLATGISGGVLTQISEQVADADILIPTNQTTTGTDGNTKYTTTALAFFVASETTSATGTPETTCTYHRYFVKPTGPLRSEMTEQDPTLMVGELRHFTKAYTFPSNLSCMENYQYLHTASVTADSGCTATTVITVGSPVVGTGQRCEVLLPRINIYSPVFTYMNSEMTGLPRIADTADTLYTPSAGVVQGSIGAMCSIDPTLATRTTNKWYGPGTNVAMVMVTLVQQQNEGSNVWQLDKNSVITTPQYVAMGGAAC